MQKSISLIQWVIAQNIKEKHTAKVSIEKQSRTPPHLMNEYGSSEDVTSTSQLCSLSKKGFREKC